MGLGQANFQPNIITRKIEPCGTGQKYFWPRRRHVLHPSDGRWIGFKSLPSKQMAEKWSLFRKIQKPMTVFFLAIVGVPGWTDRPV